MTHRIARNMHFGKKLLMATAGIAAVTLPVVIGILNAPRSQAQSPASRPEFEVASIKPSAGGRRFSGIRLSPGRMNVENLPLRRLIFNAYKVADFQISGGPGWINSDRYDIEATAKGGFSGDRMPLMLRNASRRQV